MLTHISTFSGGLDGMTAAATMAGFETTAFCEIDDYCQRVLRGRHPGRPVYGDIRELTVGRLRADGVGRPTVLSGGVPCQPASAAGRRGGASDARWLWPAFLRLCGDVRPDWIVAENPSGLLSLAGGEFGWILREMAALGYSVGFDRWKASDVGAPHERERVFLIARRCAVGDTRGVVDGWARHDKAGNVDSAAAEASRRGQDTVLRSTPRSGGTSMALPDGGRCDGRASGSSRDQRNGPQARRNEGDSGAESGREVVDALRDESERDRRPGALAGAPGAPQGAVRQREWLRDAAGRGDALVGDAERAGLQGCAGQRAVGAGRVRGVPATGRGRDGRQGQPQPRLGAHADGLSERLAGVRWPAPQGPYQHPHEPPRLAQGVAERRAQVQAIGNGIVWQMVWPIFAAIAEIEGAV